MVYLFLGAFAKLRKATVSHVIYVCLSVLQPTRVDHLGSHSTQLNEIWYLMIIRKSVQKFAIWLKYDKNNGHFARRFVDNYDKNKESRNRPGVAQRVPGGLGSQITWHSAREVGEIVSLTHPPPLPPGIFLVLVFTRVWVDPRAMVRSEGNISLKNSLTPPGIDPGTVVQRFNHYATPGPSYSNSLNSS
jgi:hypothetical protein